jgi:hypothetical protein
MNHFETEFLANDRIADLRREVTAARLAAEPRPKRASWPARIEAVSTRTVGRLRLALRLANGRGSGEPSAPGRVHRPSRREGCV